MEVVEMIIHETLLFVPGLDLPLWDVQCCCAWLGNLLGLVYPRMRQA